MEIINTYVNGSQLAKNQYQKRASENRKMYNGDLALRYAMFENRFVAKEIRGTQDSLPIEAFYPTRDYSDVISEVNNQLPVNFNIIGKESDFLRNSLIEGSHLKSLLSSVYLEGLLSSSAFVLIKPKFSSNLSNQELMVLDLQVLPFENCYPEYDVLTGELKSFIYQEERMYTKADQVVRFLYTVEYTKNTIRTYIRNTSGMRIPDLPDDIVNDNPFKDLNTLPVVEFKCSIEKDKREAFASKLIECQHQLDNINTNIENLINMHSNPIYIIEQTRRDWDNVEIGAGQILTLQEQEKFHIEKSDMQLVALQSRFKAKKDEIYKTGCLVPLSLRDRMYGTDSSKVVKIASSELIGIARIFMNQFKQPLLQISNILLHINGKQLTNEVISPPEEVLPYDLETVFATMAVGMNLGLVDDDWFWNKYMPELSDDEKDRIRENYKKRYEAGNVDENTANVDNRAKVTKPIGNKAQNQMSKEEKDKSVLKAK